LQGRHSASFEKTTRAVQKEESTIVFHNAQSLRIIDTDEGLSVKCRYTE